MVRYNPTRRRGPVARLAALTAVLVMAVTGCTGADDDEPRPGAGGSEDATQDAQTPTTARIGVVEGRLPQARRRVVLSKVTDVVEGWWDAAYGGGDAGPDLDAALADFTPDARALARRQRAVMSSGKAAGGADVAEITRKVVTVDVLAPGGEVAGATARFRLDLGADGTADRVTGRLVLTPTKQGWKVFAFDVRRGVGG